MPPQAHTVVEHVRGPPLQSHLPPNHYVHLPSSPSSCSTRPNFPCFNPTDPSSPRLVGPLNASVPARTAYYSRNPPSGYFRSLLLLLLLMCLLSLRFRFLCRIRFALDADVPPSKNQPLPPSPAINEIKKMVSTKKSVMKNPTAELRCSRPPVAVRRRGRGSLARCHV